MLLQIKGQFVIFQVHLNTVLASPHVHIYIGGVIVTYMHVSSVLKCELIL